MSVGSRYELLVEGFLDIKTPPDSPERIFNKAWRRQWVSATAVIPVGVRGEPHLTLLISQTKEDQLFSKKHIKASRDGLKLFRCRSGSRPLKTWGMSSGSTLLLYLAAKTEEDTQIWMARIRNGMWPPIMVPPSTHTEYTPEVSLIEDERSFTSGLVGAYGRIVQTSEDALCLIHPHWRGIQMRWNLKDILDVRLIRTAGKGNTAGVFQITVRSYKDDKRLLRFYCSDVVKAIEWIRCVSHGTKEDPRDSNSLSAIQSTETNSVSETASEYTLIQKPQDADKLKVVSQMGSDIHSGSEKDEKCNGTASLNIPEAFLDASLSSTTFAKAKTGQICIDSVVADERSNAKGTEAESDDSPGEMYEHLYENIDSHQSREARSCTVYEEVVEPPGEYVPPMPPSLPKRPPATTNQMSAVMSQEPSALRLQKLCESVTEALKIAEEKPSESAISPVSQKRKSQKSKKESKALVKHHSLKSSPKLRLKKSGVSQSDDYGDLKRRVSDSDIKRATGNGCDLPLLSVNYQKSSPLHPEEIEAKYLNMR
ncbi:hypothetical protein JTE90_009954 [Oedothorax gibbosus]|uniref:PH domain-containing protein n=1 Tax=Oedothorax gibbosus TaxID=931172 RepID=A0AAV6V631_9ARAC|nr:hypothetical protein JTE90_009954 [Oedothorax gibbosus]